jgi:ATP-binding cassette subfamily B protein
VSGETRAEGKLASTNVSRIFAFLGKRIWQFFAGVFIVSLLAALTSVGRALLLKDAMNSIVSGNEENLLRSGILLAFVLLVNFLGIPRFWKLFMDVYPLAGRDIRDTTMGTIMKLPMDFFEAGHSGDLLSRINADINSMLGIFGVRFRRFITPVIMVLFLSVAMFALEWRFALVLILLNILVAALNLFFVKPVKKESAEIQKGMGGLSSLAVDMLAGISCVKIFPMEERVFAGFAKESRGLARHQALRSLLEGGLNGMNTALNLAGNIGAFFLGMFFMSRGDIDLGTLLAFSSLQTDIGKSFLGVAEYFPQVQKSFAGADRLFEILDRRPEPERLDCLGAEGLDSEIGLEGINFGYAEGKPVLNGISLCVPRGKVAALVGESGGGKTTLLKLILGFYPLWSGSIRLAGRPYGSYTLEELRGLCAWVPQEPYLFDGTIRENISLGRLSATEAELRTAAENANALKFILGLKDGFDSKVGQGGLSLSGGQRQRIAIARALLKDAPILLLDEATSHLDSRSEQLVQEALERLMRGRTSIVVAHRLSTIRHADLIYVMEGGRITEEGSHEELIERRGVYYRLWEKTRT